MSEWTIITFADGNPADPTLLPDDDRTIEVIRLYDDDAWVMTGPVASYVEDGIRKASVTSGSAVTTVSRGEVQPPLPAGVPESAIAWRYVE